jgi:hypothetical protein
MRVYVSNLTANNTNLLFLSALSNHKFVGFVFY